MHLDRLLSITCVMKGRATRVADRRARVAAKIRKMNGVSEVCRSATWPSCRAANRKASSEAETGARLQLERFGLCRPLLDSGTAVMVGHATVHLVVVQQDGCGLQRCTRSDLTQIDTKRQISAT